MRLSFVYSCTFVLQGMQRGWGGVLQTSNAISPFQVNIRAIVLYSDFVCKISTAVLVGFFTGIDLGLVMSHSDC